MIFLDGVKIGLTTTIMAITSPSISTTPIYKQPPVIITQKIESPLGGDYNMTYSRNIQNQYLANNNTKNKLLNLFGDTRSLTAEEHEIYKKILHQGAEKIALKVW